VTKFKTSEIENFHGTLIGKFKKNFKLDVTIQPIDVKYNWKKVREGENISFQIVPEEKVNAERKIGDRCPVFCLLPHDILAPTLWSSWHEKWKSCGNKKFVLLEASLTFFWGVSSAIEQQLYRAEWSFPSQTDGKAAQPHWHFDATIPMSINPNDESQKTIQETPKNLIELPSSKAASHRELIDAEQVLKEGSLSGLHLGQGGWKNGETHPKRWQCEMSELKDLSEWVICVLELSRSEFEGVKSL
jgi:hypothetical protein